MTLTELLELCANDFLFEPPFYTEAELQAAEVAQDTEWLNAEQVSE